MLDSNSIQAASARLSAQSDAVARLARDAGAFAAVVAAFEAEDGEAVRWVLDRLELYPYCELICEWLRIKLCALRCVEVCGPPRPDVELPALPAFAGALVTLGRHESVVRRLVDAVACGDSDTYHRILAENELEAFCHLICRWICSIRYERICEIVCGPRGQVPTDPAADVAKAARALESFTNRAGLEQLGNAAIELLCEEAQQALGQGFQGQCEIICRLICVWRTTWVCRELCQRPVPVLAGAYAVAEAREFALAAKALAAQPRIAASLVQAVAAHDAKAYGALVARLGFEPYCFQVCGWVGSLVCFEFCLCVCPNPAIQAPEWTNIGYILVTSDIDATGRTTVARSGAGGVGYAFYDNLQLTGFCAATSSITPGAAMMYRFQYAANGGAATPVVDGMLNSNPFQVAGLPAQMWPDKDASGNATSTSVLTSGGAVFVCNSGDVPFPITTSPAVRPAPGVGDPWYPPQVYVWPDATTGWIQVYQNTYAGFFSGFMDFNSETIQLGQNPNTGFALTDIGAPIPASATLNGVNVTFTFEATRTTSASPPDYQQTPVLIRLNNNAEVNELYFQQFLSGSAGCCTPITSDVTILFSVDHEEMSPFSLEITSCALATPISLLPTATPPATVTIDARGGYGSIDQTITSGPCSYTVTLTTTPLLTTGVINHPSDPNRLTFCICGP
ncbi:MAG TPA: hypothetical protein VMU81_18540 [Acetobacteraceae bacterium]|nr:hypothetical protein [Acetobacteraceae bacterium]